MQLPRPPRFPPFVFRGFIFHFHFHIIHIFLFLLYSFIVIFHFISLSFVFCFLGVPSEPQIQSVHCVGVPRLDGRDPPPPKRSFPTPEQPLGRSARRAVSVLRFCWRSAVQWTSGLELGVGGFCLLGEPALGSNFSQWKASCEAGSNLTFMNDTCLHGHRGVP